MDGDIRIGTCWIQFSYFAICHLNVSFDIVAISMRSIGCVEWACASVRLCMKKNICVGSERERRAYIFREGKAQEHSSKISLNGRRVGQETLCKQTLERLSRPTVYALLSIKRNVMLNFVERDEFSSNFFPHSVSYSNRFHGPANFIILNSVSVHWKIIIIAYGVVGAATAVAAMGSIVEDDHKFKDIKCRVRCRRIIWSSVTKIWY